MVWRFRILLVEDDTSDAKLALAMFKEMEMADQACHVEDGARALDFLNGRGAYSERSPLLPAVILLDLKLPGLNGFEVLEQVRATPQLSLVPVVVLSSSAHERDVERAYRLGANGYVVKSIGFDAYRAALHAICKYWGGANEPPRGCERNGPGLLNL